MNDAHGGLPVVAAVDGSPSSMDAVRWAAREAARLRSPLRLVNVCDLPPLNPTIEARPLADYEETWVESGRRWVAEARDMATDATPDAEIETDVYVGDTTDVLVDESTRARLIVLGTRGLGGVRRMMLGSVTVAVSAHAACPVVVVPAGTATVDTGPVVVGVDASPLGEDAVAFAFRTAVEHSAPLTAVRAYHEPWPEEVLELATSSHERERFAQRQERGLREHLASWREKYPQVEVAARAVRAARPTDALLDAAHGARMLVVGSHGRGVVSGVLLGSTSHALLQSAPCPVAIIPHQDHSEGQDRS